MIQVPGLFTGQYCCSGKDMIHEAVLVYCEWIMTKLVRQDRPAEMVKKTDV